MYSSRLILRVCVEDNSPFFGKFGCSVPVGKKLLDCALAMGLEVVGLRCVTFEMYNYYDHNNDYNKNYYVCWGRGGGGNMYSLYT